MVLESELCPHDYIASALNHSVISFTYPSPPVKKQYKTKTSWIPNFIYKDDKDLHPLCNLVLHSAVSFAMWASAVSFAMRASSFLIIPFVSVWNSFLCCWNPVQKPLAFAVS